MEYSYCVDCMCKYEHVQMIYSAVNLFAGICTGQQHIETTTWIVFLPQLTIA